MSPKASDAGRCLLTSQHREERAGVSFDDLEEQLLLRVALGHGTGAGVAPKYPGRKAEGAACTPSNGIWPTLAG